MIAVERSHLFALGALTLVGAMIRFATLDVQSFHHDEAVTASRVILPNFFDTLTQVVNSERSPPLFYVVTWPWAKLFGTGEVGLRSLSALIGTLTVPAAWLAGRELATPRAGLVVGALVALNPILVWYSQEARSYALLILFSTLALALFARAERERSPRALALWAAASALALCSHYFAVFLIAPQLVWLVMAAPAASRRSAVVAGGAVVAVGLALMPLAIAQEGGDRRNIFAETPLADRALEAALDTFAGEEPNPFLGDGRTDAVQAGAFAFGALALAAAVALLLAAGTGRERRGAVLAAGVFVSATAVPIALALAGLDFANPRNLVGGCVPLLAVLGIGFAVERRRRLGLAAATAACLAFATTVAAANTLERMQRDDWRSVADAIGEADESRVVIANQNGDDPLVLYLGAHKLERKPYPDGVRVSEVVTVGRYPAINPPPELRLASEDTVSAFFARRFEAAEPVRVRPGEYRDLLDEPSVALVAPPG